MAEVINMPKMNLTMEDGLLSQWYVSVGDTVKQGDALFSVENEKEVADVESMYNGVVAKIIGEEGTKYNIYEPMCIVAQPDEDIVPVLADLEAKKAAAEAKAHEEAEKAAELKKAQQDKPALQKTVIMPKIRKLLKEKGISSEEMSSMFGNIKITEKEVAAYEKKYAAFRPGENDEVEQLSPMMLAISRNMKLSCDMTARLTNFTEVDMTDTMNEFGKRKAAGESLSVTALLIKSAALALQEHRVCNAVYDEPNTQVIYRGDINIGCAVDVEHGLMVPVIRNADSKSLIEISDELRALSKSAQEGSLSAADMADGTFTVTSIGMLDCTFFTPLINYPQTAILGVGSIRVLPRYLGEDYSRIHPRKIMTIGVTYDHRVVNGAPAMRFLQSVRNILQDCDKLFG